MLRRKDDVLYFLLILLDNFSVVIDGILIWKYNLWLAYIVSLFIQSFEDDRSLYFFVKYILLVR